jgi:hypothetical protein
MRSGCWIGWIGIAAAGLIGCSSSRTPGSSDAGTSQPAVDAGGRGRDAASGRDAATGASDGGSVQRDSGSARSRCELSFEAGPCEAAIPVYWFNAETGACEQRTYGGCEGNANRFDTLLACQQACPETDAVACESEGDCGWGEIGREIRVPSDCMCLFGCPYLPLSHVTIARRQAQYQALCDPQTDGQGNPCPIDDCIPPPPAMCIEDRCTGDLHGG